MIQMKSSDHLTVKSSCNRVSWVGPEEGTRPHMGAPLVSGDEFFFRSQIQTFSFDDNMLGIQT